MQEVFDKLKELQEVLLDEFDIEAEIDNIPKELNLLKKNFQRISRTLKENESNLANLNEKLKILEKEKTQLNLNKDKYESQISLIKTQREYEAITSEIAQIKEKLEEINEEEVNGLQEIEDLKKVLEEQNELHDQLKKTIADKEKEVNKLLNTTNKELDKCLKEKVKIKSIIVLYH